MECGVKHFLEGIMQAPIFDSLSPMPAIHDAGMSARTSERQLLATRLLRRANKGLRIKQETLAEDFGRDQSTINRWIRVGVPEDGADLVIEWAQRVGVGLDDAPASHAHNMQTIDEPEITAVSRLRHQDAPKEARAMTDDDRKQAYLDRMVDAARYDIDHRNRLYAAIKSGLHHETELIATGTDPKPD